MGKRREKTNTQERTGLRGGGTLIPTYSQSQRHESDIITNHICPMAGCPRRPGRPGCPGCPERPGVPGVQGLQGVPVLEYPPSRMNEDKKAEPYLTHVSVAFIESNRESRAFFLPKCCRRGRLEHGCIPRSRKSACHNGCIMLRRSA